MGLKEAKGFFKTYCRENRTGKHEKSKTKDLRMNMIIWVEYDEVGISP